MSIQSNVAPSYILGQSSLAEHRLELLNELTSLNFVEAMKVLPNQKVRVLIIGCGSGHLEERISRVFSDSHFFGIDNSAQRLSEARARVGKLEGSNTYEFIEADLTTLSVEGFEPYDILISRFVLSHLSNGIKYFERFISLVRPGGYVCFEELASDGSEHYCNTKNEGYQTFFNMLDIQIKAQQSSFEIGFVLLSELTKRSCKLHHCHLWQPILRSERDKSIIRLGFEDARPLVLKHMDEEKMNKIISSLREFEGDEQAYGLYTRSLAVIAQVK